MTNAEALLVLLEQLEQKIVVYYEQVIAKLPADTNYKVFDELEEDKQEDLRSIIHVKAIARELLKNGQE